MINVIYSTCLNILALTILLTVQSCSGQSKEKEEAFIAPDLKTKKLKRSKSINGILNNKDTSIENDGLKRTHYQNGQLKSEGNYVDGLKEGLHKEWQENGVLELEGFYVKGKANGLMKWYHEQGHLAAKGNMIKDIRNGPWIICDVEENGFCIEAYFKDGRREGVWKINHENARDKLWKEQTWVDDKIVSEKCWDETGKEIDCE